MSHVSPYFKEDFYKGQDVVSRGIRVPLKTIPKDEIWDRLSRNAQRNIKKAAAIGTLEIHKLQTADLPELRDLWFDKKDETFPERADGHLGYVATITGKVVGGIILTPSGSNLFLHQLIADKEGKEAGVPIMLVWYAIDKLYDSKLWNAIDIGVSYNPKRYRFFKNFEIETYPIILKKPFYCPTIRLTPFTNFVEPKRLKSGARDVGEITYVPRASYGIYAILKSLNLQPDDVVTIIKTFGSNYISGCVTSMIEKVCKWRLNEENHHTKVVLVIHEFGIPCGKITQLQASHWKERGIVIIEDCAWMTNKMYSFSDYGVFSFQKMHNMNFGGYITSLELSDDFLWSIGCFDFTKKERGKDFLENCFLDVGAEKRKKNWLLYDSLVKADGMKPDACYDYKTAVEQDWWIPTVYLQKFQTDQEVDELVKRLEEFGIQAGHYWGEPVLFLPIHQSMSKQDIEYMFAVVKGYTNLCANYNKA